MVLNEMIGVWLWREGGEGEVGGNEANILLAYLSRYIYIYKHASEN